jgi:arylsulfatase A-like enzyme
VALALWAAQAPAVDAHQAGAEARQLEALVLERYGHEIGRVGIAIAAAAFLVGAGLGAIASGLVALRDRLACRPPRGVASRSCLVVAIVAALHGALELWGMAHDPQLYATSWYARGGVRRTVQVVATDVLGPAGIIVLAILGCAALLAGPRSRWHAWPERASHAARALRTLAARARRLVYPGVAAIALLAAAALARLPRAHAAPGDTATAASTATAIPDDPRPNILVLAADSLRADRLDPRTAPHLDAMAARGTRFDRSYVSLPRTFPSWVTLLTGRHPHHHGIRSMFPRWEERARDFDAVPERFARAGWSTAVVSDYAGDIFSRIDLGFGTVDVPEFDFRQLVRQRAIERETPLLPVLHSRVGHSLFPVLREMNDAADPGLLARDAVRAMRRLERRGPFFLVVFFSTAHFPYAAPWPYYRRFADTAYRGRFKYHKPVGLGREEAPDARDEQQVRALYDGAVRAVDDAAQSILDAVDADGLGRNTVVVVTADHGETLYDHGHGQGHGDHLFGDEGTHVPLVIVDPRQAGGRREGSIVRDVDLAPTLYELAGVAPSPEMDGRSLAPALAGAPIPPALAYAETELWFTEDIPALPSQLRIPYPDIAHLTEIDPQRGDELVLRADMRALAVVAKHRMVREDRWKLVYAPTRQGVRWMLFDTQSDPGETQDVAGAHPDVLARLQGELWAWMRGDPEMTERGGFLVPRPHDESSGTAPGAGDALVRLDDGRPKE